MFSCTFSIGTNLGNREENIKTSLALIHSQISQFLLCVSRVVETQAILLANSPQEWNMSYLNCIVQLKTNLKPLEILTKIKEIEKKMGRNLLAPKWSPRIIDIDILFYNNEQYNDENLIIPHPQIQNRPFILQLLEEMQ